MKYCIINVKVETADKLAIQKVNPQFGGITWFVQQAIKEKLKREKKK